MTRIRKIAPLFRAGIIALSLMLAVVLAAPAGSARASANGVVISQVYGGGGNAGATLRNDFIEIFNAGTSPITITGWSVQYASSAGTTWQRTNLNAFTLQPGQYYLVQEAAGTGGTVSLPTPDATGSIAMSATAGKVALVNNQITLSGSNPIGGPTVVDFIGYGSAANAFEGAGPAPTLTNTTSDVRAASGCTDTDNNATDFSTNDPATLTPPRNTATALHPCNVDQPPSVSTTNPADGASGVAVNANVSVTFSEPVTVSGAWYDITCTASGNHPASHGSGPQTFVLNPTVNFNPGENCTVTVFDSQVFDQDLIDPPDNMDANYVFSFDTVDLTACGTPATPINAVQGSGDVTPMSGSVVTIEGIVTGDFQGTAFLRGFYLQEEDAEADADPLTSEGVFVFDGSFGTDVNVGDHVRVTGSVTEFDAQTEITNVASVLTCGTGALPATVSVSLPFAASNSAEPTEGMLVTLPQTLTATEVFTLGRFGEVLLSSGGRLMNPTNVVLPGAPAVAYAAANRLNEIVLDDGRNSQNPDPTPYMFGEPTLRVGDSVTGVTGIMSYGFGTYRIEPTGAASFDRTNPRTPSPEDVGGMLKVGAFNVLNYFNGDGAGGGFPTPRGANNLTEFNRQREKTIAAMLAANTDVAGLMEMENDNTSTELGAIEDLVDGLNAIAGPGTYAFIDTGIVGTDQIRVAVIYKPASVTPVGPWATLTTGPFTNRSRPPIAQTFEENATGEQFIFVVNHLKSKGSCPSDSSDPNADQGDGQSCWNPVRVESVDLMLDWLATDPTGTGEPDVLIMGDMNAYAKEDPIAFFESNGYTNLIASHLGVDAYSYVFDGESGYLDHALSSASLTPRVTGVTDWHNNADEPIILDYNLEFKSAAQQALNVGTPYRASDHDPVIVGLTLGEPRASVAPGSINFGNQVVGATSASHPVTVTNTGTLPLNIGGVSITGDFAIAGDTCSSASVAPGGSCTVDVTFNPSVTGSRTGKLTIPSNADSSPDKVNLSGTGVQPGVDVSPASLSFGDQRVGTTSAAQNVTLTSDGTAPLNVTGISASGDFAVSGGTCPSAPFTLAVGASCDVGVVFAPNSTGSHAGNLTVSSDAPSSSDSVALDGTGVQPALSLSSASLDFGSQQVGTTSAAQSVTLSSTGSLPLEVSGVSASGDFAVSGGTCPSAPFMLAVGDNCAVDVTFSPSAVGPRTGTLTVSSDAPTSPDAVSLSGSGFVIELLVNGGFEDDGNADGIPDAWDPNGLVAPEGQDCTVAYAGLCSLQMGGSGPTRKVTQFINASGDAGDSFLFGVFNQALDVKGGGPFQLVINLSYTDGTTGEFKLNFASGTYDWTESTLAFSSAKPYDQIKVMIQFGKKGTAWFDAASLILLP